MLQMISEEWVYVLLHICLLSTKPPSPWQFGRHLIHVESMCVAPWHVKICYTTLFEGRHEWILLILKIPKPKWCFPLSLGLWRGSAVLAQHKVPFTHYSLHALQSPPPRTTVAFLCSHSLLKEVSKCPALWNEWSQPWLGSTNNSKVEPAFRPLGGTTA